MTLTTQQIEALQAIFIGIDNLTGAWPAIKKAMEEFGIEDPDTAFEDLRNAAFND